MDEVKWSMIILVRSHVCGFISKVLLYTLPPLMLRTTLCSRDVSGYNKEESDHLQPENFPKVRRQKSGLWTSTGQCPLPRSVTALFPGTAEQRI